MTENRIKSCSFTGHRTIKHAHEPKIRDLLCRAVEYVYSLGARTFFAGGAVGFDTLAAKEIIRFRMSHPDVRLVLLLPCTNQDERWTAAQRSVYEFTLSSADEVVYLAEEYTDDCMRRRNEALVREGDVLIAYVGNSRSGAAQTARMGEKAGKKVYNLYPSLENNT